MKKSEHKEFDSKFETLLYKKIRVILKKHGYDAYRATYGFDPQTKEIYIRIRAFTEKERQEEERIDYNNPVGCCE